MGVPEFASGCPGILYHNPLIGETQYGTLEAVHNAAMFLEEVALPWNETQAVGLGKSATGGFIGVLRCMAGALAFEIKHRSKEYEPQNDS